jgi:murein DD-endopeptidase MepM/ murein hydrolase activator NlpD
MVRSLPRAVFTFSLAALLLAGCYRPGPTAQVWQPETTAAPLPAQLTPQGSDFAFPTQRSFTSAYNTPTPDAPHSLPTLRSQEEQYVVQSGDYLALIAARYNINISSLAGANGLSAVDWLQPGQVLTIPAPQPNVSPSSFKIIPDSELVNGPMSATLDVDAFIQTQSGYLSRYSETVDEKATSGAEVLKRISREYSVSPRLLLAILEYQSGWLSQANPPETIATYPMGLIDTNRKGLYRQLAWAASQLNYGYYLYKVNGLAYTQLADGSLVTFPATLNAGTVAVQRFFAQIDDASTWQNAVSQNGLYATYARLFGIPFDLSVEPLIPADLSQPEMRLPFEDGAVWSFTGGPHAGWDAGSAWAALDFAPPGTAYGCFTSDAWEVAVANGVITRSENGEVVLDLDGDGLEQTGWTILYMHVATQDRIRVGTVVQAGDRIGHPSCEGGLSNGTHLHIARRYNGEWISADGEIPFVMDGWTSHGDGTEYDGTLSNGGISLTAWDGRIAENQIQR